MTIGRDGGAVRRRSQRYEKRFRIALEYEGKTYEVSSLFSKEYWNRNACLGGKRFMDKELRILILEDIPADAELEEHELRKSGLVFTLKVVDTKEAFLKELDEFSPDTYPVRL